MAAKMASDSSTRAQAHVTVRAAQQYTKIGCTMWWAVRSEGRVGNEPKRSYAPSVGFSWLQCFCRLRSVVEVSVNEIVLSIECFGAGARRKHSVMLNARITIYTTVA